MAPRKAYFELLDQPEKITVCTLKVPTIKNTKSTYSNSTSEKLSEPGTRHQKNNVKNNIKKGDAIKIAELELEVENISFKNSFNPSATGCKRPCSPVSSGPLRLCELAITLRSTNVTTAIVNNNGTISERNETTIMTKFTTHILKSVNSNGVHSARKYAFCTIAQKLK
jgi:hypothetical protein